MISVEYRVCKQNTVSEFSLKAAEILVDSLQRVRLIFYGFINSVFKVKKH